MSGVNNRLREIRTAEGLSIQKFADKLGIDKARLHRLETGASALDIATMRQIAHKLGLKASHLLLDQDVEFRAGPAEQAIREAVESVSPDDMELFLRICGDVGRMVRRASPRHHHVKLTGNEKHATELAELWNGLDNPGRVRVLAFLRGAVALDPSGHEVAAA
jgi:transcriptional regulator with XRE-family HTH domain